MKKYITRNIYIIKEFILNGHIDIGYLKTTQIPNFMFLDPEVRYTRVFFESSENTESIKIDIKNTVLMILNRHDLNPHTIPESRKKIYFKYNGNLYRFKIPSEKNFKILVDLIYLSIPYNKYNKWS